MTKAEAGRLGGTSTFRKHGKKHMQDIGKRGARTFWKLYRITPYGTSDFAIIRRSDNEFIGTMSGQWRM